MTLNKVNVDCTNTSRCKGRPTHAQDECPKDGSLCEKSPDGYTQTCGEITVNGIKSKKCILTSMCGAEY